MKIVINTCHGGFGLSMEAARRMAELGHKLAQEALLEKDVGRWGYVYFDNNLGRNDPTLIQVVEEMGETAAGAYSRLEVVEVPDDQDWYVHEYDGYETIEYYDISDRKIPLL